MDGNAESSLCVFKLSWLSWSYRIDEYTTSNMLIVAYSQPAGFVLHPMSRSRIPSQYTQSNPDVRGTNISAFTSVQPIHFSTSPAVLSFLLCSSQNPCSVSNGRLRSSPLVAMLATSATAASPHIVTHTTFKLSAYACTSWACTTSFPMC